MFGPMFPFWLEETMVVLKAHQEGREPTAEEYGDAFKRAWDTMIEAGTMHTMAQIKAAEVTRPRRGMLGRLFG